jgi:hypothetical protein
MWTTAERISEWDTSPWTFECKSCLVNVPAPPCTHLMFLNYLYQPLLSKGGAMDNVLDSLSTVFRLKCVLQ